MVTHHRRRLLGIAIFSHTLGAASLAWGQTPVAPQAEPHPETKGARPPKLLEAAQPDYPEAARAQGIHGTVVLRVTIDDQGQVTAAEVVSPLGQGLDEAARAAALRYRFEPASRDGKPIASRIRVEVVFELPEAAPPASLEPPAPAPPPVAPAVVAAGPAAPATQPPVDSVDVNVAGELTAEQRLEQSDEAVNVVDLHRARQQAGDMGEVLARTSGVVIRREGGLGSSERIALDGMYDDAVVIFIDGIPIDLAEFPLGVGALPINLFERIEIYRGVVPIRFASDTLGGAINMVTYEDYTTHANAAYQVGSFGTHRLTLNGRYRSQQTGFIAGAAAYLDGTKNNYEVDVEIPDEKGRLSPARVERFHDRYSAAGGKVDVGVVDRKWAKLLQLSAFYAQNAKEVQHNVVMTVPYGEVHWDSRVYGATARYQVDLPHDVSPELVLAYSRRRVHFEDHGEWVYNWLGERVRERRVPGEIEADPTDQLNWQHSLYGRAGVSWQIAPAHALSLTSGTQYTTRTGDEKIQADPDARDPLTAERKLLTVISGLEYRVKPWKDDRVSNTVFVKDYHYRAKSEEPLPGGAFRKRDVTSHREGIGDGLRVRLTPWLLSKASYELATNLPEPDQVFGDGMLVRANLDLAPEISHNANVGVGVDLKRTRAGDFNAETTLFYRDSDDMIILLGNDRYYTYQNVYRARTWGLENSLAWASPGRYLGLDGTLTWIDSRNASTEGTFSDFEGDRIPNRPYLTAAWGARLRFAGFPGNDDTIEPYYIGRFVHEFFRGWESQGLREFKQVVPSQLTHVVGITWSVLERIGKTTASFEVDNLTNAKAFDNFGVERPGRAYYLKLEASF